MKFEEATYWPSTVPKPFVDYSMGEIEAETFDDVCSWTQKALRKSAVLLFCGDEHLDYIRVNLRYF